MVLLTYFADIVFALVDGVGVIVIISGVSYAALVVFMRLQALLDGPFQIVLLFNFLVRRQRGCGYWSGAWGEEVEQRARGRLLMSFPFTRSSCLRLHRCGRRG